MQTRRNPDTQADFILQMVSWRYGNALFVVHNPAAIGDARRYDRIDRPAERQIRGGPPARVCGGLYAWSTTQGGRFVPWDRRFCICASCSIRRPGRALWCKRSLVVRVHSVCVPPKPYRKQTVLHTSATSRASSDLCELVGEEGRDDDARSSLEFI